MIRDPDADTRIGGSELGTALDGANLPALVMTLYHLTGDDAWLQAPFRPTRARGLDQHAGGGFSPDVAAHIRESAREALAAYHRGEPARAGQPDLETFGAMLDSFLAQPVPEEYRPMFAMSHGLLPDPVDVGPLEVPEGFCVAIVGAGISGMLAAVRLRAAGVRVRIFERQADVGGVWLSNRYPGAGVDTPSNLYSYTDFPSPWSVAFARRDEVLSYLRRYAEVHDIHRDTSFETTVDSCRWDEPAQRWEITTSHPGRGAETTTAGAVITAVGLFGQPFEPDVAGRERFAGDVFHSANWPEGYRVDGKRIAVVGSGASAMQVVPAICDTAADVLVLQRTPQWIAPVDYYFDAVPDGEHRLQAHVPYYTSWIRTRSAWNFNDRNHPSLVVDPEWPLLPESVNALNERQRQYFLGYISSMLGDDPDLEAKAVPHYPPYGKRILLDNGWYDALRKPTVRLESDGLAGLTETGVIGSSGRVTDVDTVVLCTGFQTSRYLQPMKIVGRHGADLRETWSEDDPSAYLGLTAPGFPNLFFMYGPATNPGGGSFVSIAESQIRSITQLLAHMVRTGARSVEPRADVTEDYNARMDDAHAKLVWSYPGFTTYVRNSKGRVTVNMPWRVVDYWSMTREPRFDDYVFGRGERERAPEGAS